METALIGLVGVLVGALLQLASNLISLRQRRTETELNSALQIRERRIARAYEAAAIDWKQRIDAIGANGGTLPLSVFVIYHTAFISHLDESLALENLDDVAIANALEKASHALDVAIDHHAKLVRERRALDSPSVEAL